MRKACLLQIALVVIGGTATSFSQSYPESALCQSALAVGEIPNSPLMADIVEKARNVGSDGVLGPQAITERLVGYVARDSKGKVVIRTYDVPDRPRSTPGFKESDGWVEAVCDPRRKTVVQASLPPHESRGHGHTRSEDDPHRTSNTTATFRYFHYKVPGRENLGEETFEGVPAFRYRFPHAIAHPGDGLEIVNADELAVQLLLSKRGPTPSSQVELRLSNLRFTEPPKKLLDVPVWAASSSSLPQPMVPPGMQFPGGPPQ